MIVAWGVLIAPTHAQVAEADWTTIAERDVEAAYQLLVDNHPGARAEVGDDRFVEDLQRGIATARDRARQVTSEAGYRATLRGFANSVGDSHIQANFTPSQSTPLWPGVGVRRINGKFVVHYAASWAGSIKAGDELIGCDNQPIGELAARKLGGFRGVWNFEAQRIAAAPHLLIDDGNPFVEVPRRCEFKLQDGLLQTFDLHWRPEAPAELVSHIRDALLVWGRRPQGLYLEDGVAWVSLSEMNTSADALIAEVQRRSSDIAASDAIIIDLRTNGGGDSRKGELLIEALFGNSARVSAMQSASSGSGSSHWRATPFTLATIEDYATKRSAVYGEDSAEVIYWRKQAEEVRAAIAAGEAFAPGMKSDVKPREQWVEQRRHPTGSMREAYVLTDNFCASSCLILVAELRGLGVRHIGFATDASTWYMEVRHAPLPSGRATFSTLQKISFSAPRQYGPFVPDIEPTEAIATNIQLEQWVVSLVKNAQRTAESQ